MMCLRHLDTTMSRAKRTQTKNGGVGIGGQRRCWMPKSKTMHNTAVLGVEADNQLVLMNTWRTKMAAQWCAIL